MVTVLEGGRTWERLVNEEWLSKGDLTTLWCGELSLQWRADAQLQRLYGDEWKRALRRSAALPLCGWSGQKRPLDPDSRVPGRTQGKKLSTRLHSFFWNLSYAQGSGTWPHFLLLPQCKFHTGEMTGVLLLWVVIPDIYGVWRSAEPLHPCVPFALPNSRTWYNLVSLFCRWGTRPRETK